MQSYRMSSKMKNSASGPKNAVSAIPVDFRYASAFWAMLRGSRVYFSLVMGSTMLQMKLIVGTAVKGSITAVAASGMTSMSLAWIACQPRMELPSKPKPSSKELSSSWPMGTVKCCHIPGKSMNLKSANFAPFSLTIFMTSFGVMRMLLLAEETGGSQCPAPSMRPGPGPRFGAWG